MVPEHQAAKLYGNDERMITILIKYKPVKQDGAMDYTSFSFNTSPTPAFSVSSGIADLTSSMPSGVI